MDKHETCVTYMPRPSHQRFMQAVVEKDVSKPDDPMLLMDSQLVEDPTMVEDSSPKVSVTGLVSISPEKVLPSPEPSVEPKVEKPRVGKKRQETVISNPPKLEVQPELDGPVDGDVEAQRCLKRKKEDEAKAAAEEKQQAAEAKKKKQSADAVAKAKAKLEKAMAKAKALEERGSSRRGRGGTGAKRKLEPELDEAASKAAASEQDQPAAASDAATAGSPPKRPRRKASAVKLSPKAKEFASPSKKATDARMEKAVENLKLLRGLKIPDLEIPAETFAKKILACI